MIPQFAHSPRQLSQQYGNSGITASPFEPLQDPRAPSQLTPLPFRTPKNFVPSPSPTGPYSVESHASRHGLDASRSSLSFAGQYNDSSEHMLRRKTPNGTLAAGYDGSPIRWSSKVPALKHVVLPKSAVPSNQPNSTDTTPTPTEHRARQRSNSLGWNGQINGHAGARMNSDPGNWTYFSSLSNPPSNFLDHLSMQQATTFYPNNGVQIPTVIQPPYQIPPGPTASNDGGLYGPYWPDGKFVPYRPAAYRGQGYQQGAHGLDLSRGFEQQNHSPVDMLSTFRQSPYNLNSTPHIRRPSFLSLDNGSHASESGFMLPSQLSQSQHNHDNAALIIYSSTTDGSRTPTAPAKNRPSSNQFKEKTLSWAHSIYVDLLAFLHQSKTDNRQSRHTEGHRPFSKATIYPKPPRQPASSFGNSDWLASYATTSRNNTTGTREHIDPKFSSSHRSNLTGNLKSWHGSVDFGDVRYTRFSNQDMPHYVSHFHSSQRSTEPPLRPPLSKAKEALEVLTTLCEQSAWCWIDGMLLGGCLAYGLEEYHKALDWYSKIIVLDPK